ncbi:MAG TPA: hypothetical protein DIU15_12290 [Deltaproteobacteria bacterium]|nr:hypothetical protein [Deltaproteobacteria bacterium]HCP46816.1 hypothetical protein [Deltaproteobacteria bacterium]
MTGAAALSGAESVVVTSVGVLTPAGVGLDALLADPEEPQATPHTQEFALDDGSSFSVCQVPVKLRSLFQPVPKRLARLDRYPRLFLAAGLLALQDLDLSSALRTRTGVAVGSAFGCWGIDEVYHRGLVTRGHRLSSPLHFGYTVPGSAAGELSIAGTLRGPNATWVSGRCSGLLAVTEGVRWLREGRCDAVVAGAVDAQGAWLARELRDAGWPESTAGEGSVALLLERREDADRAGRQALLELEEGRTWFDTTATGDAWSVGGDAGSGPMIERLGDCFSIQPLARLLVAGLGHAGDRWSEVAATGACGHGASLRCRSGSEK